MISFFNSGKANQSKSMNNQNQRLRISRWGLKLFQECPRCFWLDRKKIAKRPQPYPYTLSDAADKLAKKEFDSYRLKGTKPAVISNLIGARLFPDQALLDKWRDNFSGLNWYDQELNAELFGAIDDCLEFEKGELAVIDYKTTGAQEITIYPDYQFQMDVYTFLLEKMGYQTKKKAYFIFYSVDKARPAFNGQLLFREELREIETKTEIVYPVFEKAVETLRLEKPPSSSYDCQYCRWHQNQINF